MFTSKLLQMYSNNSKLILLEHFCCYPLVDAQSSEGKAFKILNQEHTL